MTRNEIAGLQLHNFQVIGMAGAVGCEWELGEKQRGEIVGRRFYTAVGRWCDIVLALRSAQVVSFTGDSDAS
jgi:hypothetical protein